MMLSGTWNVTGHCGQLCHDCQVSPIVACWLSSALVGKDAKKKTPGRNVTNKRREMNLMKARWARLKRGERKETGNALFYEHRVRVICQKERCFIQVLSFLSWLVRVLRLSEASKRDVRLEFKSCQTFCASNPGRWTAGTIRAQKLNELLYACPLRSNARSPHHRRNSN